VEENSELYEIGKKMENQISWLNEPEDDEDVSDPDEVSHEDENSYFEDGKYRSTLKQVCRMVGTNQAELIDRTFMYHDKSETFYEQIDEDFYTVTDEILVMLWDQLRLKSKPKNYFEIAFVKEDGSESSEQEE
jgi:uncharacterized protein YbaR (Trm112 family)